MNIDIKNEREFRDLNSEAQTQSRKKTISGFILASIIFHFATAAIVLTHKAQNMETHKDIVEINFSTPVSEFETAPEEAPAFEKVATAQSDLTNSAPETIAPEVTEPPSNKPQEVTLAEEKVVVVEKRPTLQKIKPSQVVAASATESLKPEDLDEDLNKIEQEQLSQDTQNGPAEIENETVQAEKEIAESAQMATEQINQENEVHAAQIKARTDALKEEEQEAAQAFAEAQAAEAAKAKEAASAQVAAQKSQEGLGEKNAGPAHLSTEVRALEQLRQMPGNPKPRYDSSERLKGDKGVVIFQAFVTQEGLLNQFKLLKSTGYRNLDAKTLKALKQWKFYPGQEGWVELPFDWNLKGGPQEMPAFLRRKVGLSPSDN